MNGRTIRRDAEFAKGIDMAEKTAPGIKAAHMAFKAEIRGYSPAFLLPVGCPQTMFGHREKNYYHRKGKARQIVLAGLWATLCFPVCTR